MVRTGLWILLCMAALVSGCTSDGRVREVNGKYQKIYPDQKQGGWYYVNSYGEKVHLDQLPPDTHAWDSDTQHLQQSGSR